MRSASDWLSYHIFYHGDRELLLRRALTPAIGTLRRRSEIDAFFFIRYSLGGPHLRCRLLPAAGAAADVGRVFEANIDRVLQQWPSSESLSAGSIAGADRSLLANDPSEEFQAAVVPDNSWVRADFQPEVERYGGESLIGAALELFSVSSSVALHGLDQRRALSAGRRLQESLSLLLLQAWGSSISTAELLELVSYGASWWKRLEPIVMRAGQVFERSPEHYCGLVRHALDEARSPANVHPAQQLLLLGARALRRRLSDRPHFIRRRILTSQLHMTANRLGLGNTDEAYLCQLLRLALSKLASTEASLWRDLEGDLRSRYDPTAGTDLGTLVGAGLDAVSALDSPPRPA